jgi:NADH-quinone oxidoreductase subunit H
MGGYHALPGLGFTENWLGGWFTMVWFVAKIAAFFFLFIWLRGTLPRMRYDQFMKFGWKVLIPFSLAWIMIVSTLRVMSQRGTSRAIIIAFTAGVVLLILLISSLYESSKKRSEEGSALGDVPTPSFPVPDLARFTNSEVEHRNV